MTGTRAQRRRHDAAVLLQRFVRRRGQVVNIMDAGGPVCPITSTVLSKDRPRMKVIIDDQRRVVYYCPQALYTWMTKSFDFRCPVGRRELNRVEVARCARLQSPDPWVARTVQAYALALFDVRTTRGNETAERRAEVNTRVEAMQHCFRESLDCLRLRMPRGTTMAAFRLWHRAHTYLRELDTLSACHEAVSHMDMFTMGREMNRLEHEREFGRDMYCVTKAFVKMVQSVREHQPVPPTTYDRVRRLQQEEEARRYRRRIRVRVRLSSRRQEEGDTNSSAIAGAVAEMMSSGGGGVVV